MKYHLCSVSKTTKELQLAWKSDVAPVTLSPEVKMPQFIVQNVLAELCDEAAVLGKFQKALWFNYVMKLVFR